MKALLVAAALAVVPSLSFAQDVNGTWKTEPGDTGGYLHVSMRACPSDAAQTCGYILAAFDGTGAKIPDYENLGKPIVWAMNNEGGGSFRGGKIWAPDRDKTYNSKMSLSGNTLKVQGCVFGICRGQNWSRIN